VQASHRVSAVVDDPNLIGSAGLVPVMRRAGRAGLHALLAEHLSVRSPNAGAKAAGVVAGMLAGADCIDDLDVLRHGAVAKVSPGPGRPRRWARSCARSPSGTSASSTPSRLGPWPGSPPPFLGCLPGPPARAGWRSW